MARNFFFAIFFMIAIFAGFGCSDSGGAIGSENPASRFVPNSPSSESSFVYEQNANHLELNEDAGSLFTTGISELDWKLLEGGRIYYANGISVVEQKLKLNGTPVFTIKSETVDEALREEASSSLRLHEAQHAHQQAKQEWLEAVQNSSPDTRKKEQAMREAERQMAELGWLNYQALDLVYSLARGPMKTLGTFLKFPSGAELFKYAVSFSPPLKGDVSGVKFRMLDENAEIKRLKSLNGSVLLELKVGDNSVLLLEKQPNGGDAYVFINNKKVETKASIYYSVNGSELSLEGITYSPAAHSLQHSLDSSLSDDVQVKENYPLDLYVSQPEALLSTKWELMYNGPKQVDYHNQFELVQNGYEYEVSFVNPQREWFRFKLLEFNGSTYTASVVNSESESIQLNDNILLSDKNTTAVFKYVQVVIVYNGSGVLEAKWVMLEELNTGTLWTLPVNSGTQDGMLVLNNGSSFKFVVQGANRDELRFDHDGDGVISSGLAVIRLSKDYAVKLGKLDKNVAFPVFTFSVPQSVMENPPAVDPFLEIAFDQNASWNVSTLEFSATPVPWSWSSNFYRGLAQDGSRLWLWFDNMNNNVNIVMPETQVFYEVQLNSK